MPTPNSITLMSVQYRGSGIVTMMLVHESGAVCLPDTTEDAVRARMAVPAENWGNEDVLAEAQAWADEKWPGADNTVVWDIPPEAP